MCANYLPTRPARLREFFGVEPTRDDYTEDAHPGQVAPIVVGAAGRRSAELAVFGLIPPWSRDGRDFRKCYNARAETVAERPSFRHAWRSRQWCVVPADAFFEPCYETGRPVRWRIESADGEPLAIAGIWERWRALGGETVTSFAMLTIDAHAHPVMERFHAPGRAKRSVVLLEAGRIDQWLGAGGPDARAMLLPFAPQRVRAASAPRAGRDRGGSPAG